SAPARARRRTLPAARSPRAGRGGAGGGRRAMAAAGPLDDSAGAVRASRDRSRRIAFACALLGAMLAAAQPAAAIRLQPPSVGAKAGRAADAPGPAERDTAGRASPRAPRAPS